MDAVSKWPRHIFNTFGFANILFSISGLLLLVISATSLLFLPHEFFIKDLPFFKQCFIVMTVFNIIFVIGLFISGYFLIKKSTKAIVFSNLLFVGELLYFYVLIGLIAIPAFPLAKSISGAMGVGNMGIAFQVLPFYPMIALISLNLANNRYQNELLENPELKPLEVLRSFNGASLGVILLGGWFVFSGLLSLGARIFIYKIYGFTIHLNDQILILNALLIFILGVFILRRKDWARKGIIILAAIGLLLTMAYRHVPYFQHLEQNDQNRMKQYHSVYEQAQMERMQADSSNNYSDYDQGKVNEFKEIFQKRIQSFQQSSLIKQLPLFMSCVWFFFVYFFFTRPRVKEQFTHGMELGEKGQLFIRILFFSIMFVLLGKIYWIQIQPRQMEFLHQGQALMNKGNNAAAVNVYSKGLNILPGNGDLYAARGIAYRNMGQWQKASEEYTRALWFDPSNKELFLRRGFVFEKMNQKDKALQDYDRALKLDPYYIQALINRSIIFIQREKYFQALEDCYLVVKHAPENFDGQINMGVVYERLQRPLSALVYINKAIELRPQDALGYINRGRNYFDIGQTQKALDDFNKAISLDPRNPDAYRNRTDYWFLVKDYLKAAEDWKMVYQLDHNISDAPYWGMYSYYLAGDMNKVKEIYAWAPKNHIKTPKRTAGFYDLLAKPHSDGVIKGFDQERKIIYERTFKDGRLEGLARDFNDRGHLLNEFSFVNGQVNGNWKTYKDGIVEEEWTYKDDIIEGPVKQYDTRGKLKCVWTYENAKASGPFSCYSPEGKLRWEGNYKNGFRHGIQKSYYANGSLWTQDNYIFGDKDGQQQSFDEKGKAITEIIYKEGIAVKTQLYREDKAGNF